jgi:hypothetical protein
MTDTDGTLRLQPSGRWAIQAPGREPVEILAGETIMVEVAGSSELKSARMEQARPSGEYYVVQGYPLRDGLRAGFFDQRERYAKPLT